MAVEIRELNIKGSVGSSQRIERKFQQNNSPLLQTNFINQLKKEIIAECTEKILEKIERKKLR